MERYSAIDGPTGGRRFERAAAAIKAHACAAALSAMVALLLVAALVHFGASTHGSSGNPQWLPKCGLVHKQNQQDLLATDIFLRHLNAGTLNSSMTECGDFHRHICPRGLSSAASTQGLFDQIIDIERHCTKYDVWSNIEADFAQPVLFAYNNSLALNAALILLPKPTLLAIYEYTTLHKQEPTGFWRNIWHTRRFTPAIDQATFPAKYDNSIFTNFTKRKAFVNSLVTDLIYIVTTAQGISKMKENLLPFMKDVSDYHHLVHVLYREGMETGANRDRQQANFLKIFNEYAITLQAAPWSSVLFNGKSRFEWANETFMNVFQNEMKSSLNALSIQGASLTLARDLHVFYREEKLALAPLAVLPFLHNLIALSRAQTRSINTIDLDLLLRWRIITSKPNAVNSFFVWIAMRNQAISDLVTNNSPLATHFGSVGYVFSHELYHQAQWLYPEIMATSPVVGISESCISSYYSGYAARFPTGDPRFEYWSTEEEADVYGSENAYNAFVRAIGSAIDDVAYPAYGLTNRQLFFYSNSIFGCNVHDGTMNSFLSLPDAHYEVNGRLAQVPDFKTTFACAATDAMSIPVAEECPTFFGSYTN